MKIPVEAIGSSIIIGHWNEEKNSFEAFKRLPRKYKKELKKKSPWYNFRKNSIQHTIDSDLRNGWKSSFSIRIAKEKLNGVFHAYFAPYVHSQEKISNRDIVYRLENEKEIKHNYNTKV